jgi:hypothetical protein
LAKDRLEKQMVGLVATRWLLLAAAACLVELGA